MWANKNNSLGFTIVETLIALSVSSVLFISVVVLVSGQLAKTRSKDAAVQIQSSVQQVLNDVSTGYFPESTFNFGCAPGAPAPSVNNAGDTRGKNTGCVLAGKKITFDTNSYTVATYLANEGSMPTTIDQLAEVKLLSGETLTETKPYANSAELSGPSRTYWILFTNYDANAGGSTFVSGAQGTAVFVATGAGNLGRPTAPNDKVCIDTGTYKNSLTFPVDGSRTVTLQIDDGTC